MTTEEVMLICQVVFRDGQPALIKALTDYPNPNNPLGKAIDIEALIEAEVRKGRLDLAQEIYNLDIEGDDWRSVVTAELKLEGE